MLAAPHIHCPFAAEAVFVIIAAVPVADINAAFYRFKLFTIDLS